MLEHYKSEKIPREVIVYEAIARVIFGNETVEMQVCRDDEPETDFMRELGAMGTLRIHEPSSGILHHEERILLSASAIFDKNPYPEEYEKWGDALIPHLY